MDEIIYKVVRDIQHRKKEKRVSPCHSLDVEIAATIRQEVESSLKRLIEAGVIKPGNTLNHKCYTIIREI